MSNKKKCLLGYALLLSISIHTVAQHANASSTDNHGKKGKIITENFLAHSLQGSHTGEDPMRKLTVYLPPGYEENKQRYPVIYILHGGFDKSEDSLLMTWFRIGDLMDAAILNHHIRPMIFVLPNSRGNMFGGIYTNSALTGNWADYIAKDLVEYMDKKYRTIADRNSRGLGGHSLGGSGALKLGMLYPDVFGAVYALSPGILNWAGDFSINNPAFKTIDSFKNEYTQEDVMHDIIQKGDFSKFWTRSFAAFARAYSPDETGKSFLKAKMPVSYVGDSMIVDLETKKKWEANFPVNMIESHLTALKSLNALKLDWGRNDEISPVPLACLEFSKKLELNKVKHFAEEYIGGHVSMLGGFEGRIYTEMLPFFDAYLKFEYTPESKLKDRRSAK